MIGLRLIRSLVSPCWSWSSQGLHPRRGQTQYPVNRFFNLENNIASDWRLTCLRRPRALPSTKCISKIREIS
jgi:hypothetical protein